MRFVALLVLTSAAIGAPAPTPVPTPMSEDAQEVLVLVGSEGEPEFGEGFSNAARSVAETCARHAIPCTVVGLDPAQADARTDRELVTEWLIRTSKPSPLPLWVIYLGHGTWDGERARLNLRGPDLTAEDILSALAQQRRPFVLVHGGSAGGPFIPVLSGPDRVIVTATESGDEVNYARFGERFAAALGNPEADIDRDGRTSLLEAALSADQQVRIFYEEAGRMATEHALVDDNADSRGTPLEWFRGTRVVRNDETGAKPDGALAHRLALIESAFERSLTQEQREKRDILERELEQLRERKSSMETEDYLRELERVLRDLSPIYVDRAVEDEDT